MNLIIFFIFARYHFLIESRKCPQVFKVFLIHVTQLTSLVTFAQKYLFFTKKIKSGSAWFV